MKKTVAKISSSLVIASGFATTALAVDDNPRNWIGSIQGKGGTLPSLVTGLINWAIGLAALASVVMLIYAGFLYITANGDENKVSTATKTLTFAIVGLVVVFIAVLLVNFVLNSILDV